MDKFLEQFRLVDFFGYFCPGCVAVVAIALYDPAASLALFYEVKEFSWIVVATIGFPVVFSLGLMLSLSLNDVLCSCWEANFCDRAEVKRIEKLIVAQAERKGLKLKDDADALSHESLYCVANAVVRASSLSFLADRAYAMSCLVAGTTGAGLLGFVLQVIRVISIYYFESGKAGSAAASGAFELVGVHLVIAVCWFVVFVLGALLSKYNKSAPWEEVATACLVCLAVPDLTQSEKKASS